LGNDRTARPKLLKYLSEPIQTLAEVEEGLPSGIAGYRLVIWGYESNPVIGEADRSTLPHHGLEPAGFGRVVGQDNRR
jgi:hypothetical protein